MPPIVLSRLGKYLLLERVNQGGMADVFLAKTFGFGGADQLIALKCIRPEVYSDQAFISMFIEEAKLSALLSHANIAKTYELGRINDAYFIAMEYVSGRDLRALIDRARARGIEIPIGLALFVTAALLEGLDYAHRKIDLTGQPLGIVHSDVSPKNVIVGYAGEVKLIDFGIARAVHHARRSGITQGKIGYMSPEQVRGEQLDARSDVFAVGSLLFELLTQRRLFEGPSDGVVLDKVRNAEVLPPSLLAPRVSADLEAIVMRALGRHPTQRYASAEAMQRELVELMLRRYGHTQARELGAFVRSVFDDELRQDLGRIERAMHILAMPEQIPEHEPWSTGENTAMVSRAVIAPLLEESTNPEATRFASILPDGAVVPHQVGRPTASTAIAADEPASKPVGGQVLISSRAVQDADTELPAAEETIVGFQAPLMTRLRAPGKGEGTDDDGPASDTMVVQRNEGTDLDGETAVVRADGVRAPGRAEPPPEEDDSTERVQKPMLFLRGREQSDPAPVSEPTQVGFQMVARAAVMQGAAGSPATGGSDGPSESAAVLAAERDEEDETDRVMRASGGNTDAVPREVTIIDHSRRAAVVEEWAREARGLRSSRRRRALIVGICALVVAALAVVLRGLQRPERPGAPHVGSIVIISQPIGAEVSIDGKVVGTTPFSSPRIASGHHQVVVRNLAGKQRSLDVTIRDREVITREVSFVGD